MIEKYVKLVGRARYDALENAEFCMSRLDVWLFDVCACDPFISMTLCFMANAPMATEVTNTPHPVDISDGKNQLPFIKQIFGHPKLPPSQENGLKPQEIPVRDGVDT
ncbi:hypothetical protein VP01_1208g5 [Puccinia sorghi]|uniref:Uncharacterized protein n=1 Tax=Puccinia sorghi TaxID=27349 RepID=A0A0L6VQI5_9BASI|nr:hypothetical protein VP01_1208g5 [Puccinia sorghi]